MNGGSDRLKKIVLVAVLLLLLGLGWVFLAGTGLEMTLLSQEYYGQLMEETGLPLLLQESLCRQVLGEDPAGSLVARTLTGTLDSGWWKAQAESISGEILPFLKGEQEELVVTVNLEERAEVFRARLMEALQEAAPRELEQLEIPPALVEEFVAQIDFPDELTLLEIRHLEELDEEARKGLAGFQKYRGYCRNLPYFAILFLGLISILWTGLPGALIWMGAGMSLGGLSFAALLPVVRGVVLGAAGELLPSLAGTAGGREVLEQAAGLAGATFLNLALLYAGAGLLLLGAAVFTARAFRRRRSA